MNKIKNLALFFIFLMGNFGFALAQNQTSPKLKPYDSWIKTSDKIIKGTLYNIQDSTIQIINSNNYSPLTFHFNEIDQIKIRRKNSVLRGAVVGGIIGLFPSILLSTEFNGEMDPLSGMVVVMLGIGGAGMGACIGAGVGSLRITIPIDRESENFEYYKSKINHFALYPTNYSFKETSGRTGQKISKLPRPNVPEYAYESFAGITMGPSFLLGDLELDVPVNNKTFSAKTGYSSTWINIGYRLKGNYGISFAAFNNQYETLNNDLNEWWMINGILIGPMFTYPVVSKILFDVKPRIGYAGSALNQSLDKQVQGNGWLINPCISIRYNFAWRWCVFSEAGYFYSKQKLEETGKVNFSTFNLGFGIGYRYK